MSRIKNTLKDGGLVIDHISYTLSDGEDERYFSYLSSNLTTTSYTPKPHLTVAYSPILIDRFPVKEIEGEKYYPVHPKHVLKVNPYQEEANYTIHKDHHGHLHLAIDLSHRDDIYEQHAFYKTRNAYWFIDRYRPLLIIESDTRYTDNDLPTLTRLDFTFRFEFIRYKRFIESEVLP